MNKNNIVPCGEGCICLPICRARMRSFGILEVAYNCSKAYVWIFDPKDLYLSIIDKRMEELVNTIRRLTDENTL